MSCQQNHPLIQKMILRICSRLPLKKSLSLELPNRKKSQMPLRSVDYAGLSSDSVSRLPQTNLKPLKHVCRPASVRGNDSGQVAVVLFFLLALVFIGGYWMILGPMMDTTTSIHNNLTQGAGAPVPLTQDRQDSLIMMQGVFGSLPVIAFILLIIAAIVGALASKYNVV